MKWCGTIGFIETVEDPEGSGIFVEKKTKKKYRGDVIRFTRRWDKGEGANDDLSISNEISIIADPFAVNNVHSIRYLEWMNCLWKISNVEVQYPRLILSLGGVYNGEK